MPFSPEPLLASADGFARARAEIASETAPHAWLVVSATAGGAAFFGRALARAALCEGDVRERPCEACPTCLRTRAGTAQGLVELWPRGTMVRVDQVQALREAAALRLAGRKVFLIQRAERLGPEAGNALLKTLEEPPRHTLFVLATHRPEALLPTIISRVRRAPVELPPAADLSRRMGLAGPAARALALAMRVAGASPQVVLSIATATAATDASPSLEEVAASLTKMLKGLDATGYPTPVHALLESGTYALALTRALGVALGGVVGAGDLTAALGLAEGLKALHEKVLAAGERAAKSMLEDRREALGDALPEEIEEELGQTKLTVGRTHVDLVLTATAVLVELAIETAAGGRDPEPWVPVRAEGDPAAQTRALLGLGARLTALRGHAAVGIPAVDILAELSLAASMGAPTARHVPPDLLALTQSGGGL